MTTNIIVKRAALFSLALLLCVYSLTAIYVPKAFAATRTWDGGGSDSNFGTAENWEGDAAPGDGDSIVIPYDSVLDENCPADVTLLNDLDFSDVTLAGIAFTGEKPDNCDNTVVIGGNDLAISGNIMGNDVNSFSPVAKLTVDITAASPVIIQAIDSTGTLTIGANAVTIFHSFFTGGLSGSGNLTINNYTSSSGGGCSVTATPRPFGGDSSGFSGPITLENNGWMIISRQANDIARHASGITKESNGSVSFGLDNKQDMSLNTPITLKGGDAFVYQHEDDECDLPTLNKTLTLSGNVTLTANTTFYLDQVDLKFTGTLTGKQFVKLAEGVTGSVIFPDGSTVKSETKVWRIDDASDCFSRNNPTAGRP
jgi:hypothetical protein